MSVDENKKQEKIAIITDSCADVPNELAKEYNIFILPMLIHCKDGEYRDGVEITAQDVYERLKTEIPKTSSPLGQDIIETFKEIKRQGYTKAVAVILSGGLSGSVNHIRLAAESESDIEVVVFDSMQGSIGIGAIALQAAEYVKQGMSFDELLDTMPKLIKNTKVFFSIDTLEYLQKGGRIGKATALAGSVLQIKPILAFDEEGEIYTPAKVRGRKMVSSRLIKFVQEQFITDKPYNLIVADGGAPEEREVLEEQLKALFPNYRFCYRAKIGGALSVYLGPGLLGAGIQFLDK